MTNRTAPWRAWTASRWRESLVWTGIPMLGLFAATRPSVEELGLFALATWTLSVHILLLNDWGGLVRNPREAARLGSAHLDPRHLLAAACAALALCLAGFSLQTANLTALAACAATLNLSYSHPRLHLKTHPGGAALLHLLMGATLFLLGWLASAPFDREAAALAAFCAGVLTAGHLVHQCIDADEDAAGGVRTTAVRIGVRTTLLLGWLVFLSAHAALIAAALNGVVGTQLAAVLTLPVAAHLWMAWRFRHGALTAGARNYRVAYRVLFACASAAVVLMQLLT